MNAWRRIPRGPYYLDWQRRGLGRIARSSGTTDLRTYRKLVAMLDLLADRGRYDLLEAVRDGLLAPLQILDAFRRQRLDELPTAETIINATAFGARWTAGFAGRRAANYRTGLNRILARSPDASLQDLPDLLAADRARSLKTGQAPSFNRARAAVLACLRDGLSPRKHHPLYQRALAVAALPERRREERARLSVRQALGVRRELGNVLGEAWWALCLTGMIASELWSRPWKLRPDRIRIQGTKAAGRARDVPLLKPITRPTVNRRLLAIALTARGLETYDARRAYAHWCEEAGIPRARRKLYLGHRPADVTDLYEMGELSAYLREDAQKLAQYMEAEGAHGRRRKLRRA